MAQIIQERNKFQGLAAALQGVIQGQAQRHQRQKQAGEVAGINQFLQSGGQAPQPQTPFGQQLLTQGMTQKRQFAQQQELQKQNQQASMAQAIAIQNAKTRAANVQTPAEVRDEIRSISKQVADGDLPVDEGRRQADQLTRLTNDLINLPSPKIGGEADKQANVLRKEWNADPIVKNNEIVSTQVGIIQEAFNEATAVGMSDKSRIASDQALIIAFNKMLDPTSVVRESEFARTPEQVAILNRLLATPGKLIRGGVAITDEDRRAILDMANRAADVTGRRFNRAFDRFTNLSTRFKVDPGKIFGDITRQEDRGVGSPEAASVPEGTVTQQGIDLPTAAERRGEAAQTAAPMSAVNPQTGARIQSTDGGQTWQPVQ